MLEFKSGAVSMVVHLSYFVWRIVFACVVVCRWQVRHAGNDDDRGRSRRPNVEDQGWLGTGWILGGKIIGRSDDTVCGLYHAHGDKEHEFLG
jgi:hypothetical protein